MAVRLAVLFHALLCAAVYASQLDASVRISSGSVKATASILPPSSCAPITTVIRTCDGTCNTYNNFGATGGVQLRLIPGTDGAGRPSPRKISNVVLNQDQDVSIPNDRFLSEFTTFFGQFIDHDLVETPTNPLKPFPIPVPPGDPHVLPPGATQLDFFRSETVWDNPINEVTSFIDGSAIYGSECGRTKLLRLFKFGKLLTGKGDLLPDNTVAAPNQPADTPEFFLAGDIRANENVFLTALHTIFVREHNIIAEELADRFPKLNDEALFQRARLINTAQLQKVVYEEWLPALLGTKRFLTPYKGFNPRAKPLASVFFTTAGFRVGHTLLSDAATRLGPGRKPITPALRLKDVFFTPNVVRAGGIDPLVRGIANTLAQEVDAKIVKSLRNFLFFKVNTRFPDTIGFDLASLNIQRGRDHKLPDFNTAREFFGLARVSSFSDITSGVATAKALQVVYNGNINDIDAWVGAIAEDHLPDSSLGPLLQEAWIKEFERLRDGDRFFYLNDGLFPQELADLPRVRKILTPTPPGAIMRGIIQKTTGISPFEIPPNPFFAKY